MMTHLGKRSAANASGGEGKTMEELPEEPRSVWEGLGTGWEKVSIWDTVPGLNVLHLLIGGVHNPPTFEQLAHVVEAIGVISALMLSMAGAVPTSVDFEELQAADARFANRSSGYYELFDNNDWNYPLSVYLATDSLNAMALLGMSLLMSVFVFAIGSLLGLDSAPREVLAAWWSWSRWVVLGAFVLMITGIQLTFTAIASLIWCKFPDYFVEEHGRRSATNLRSVYGVAKSNRVYLWVVLGLVLFFLSCAISHIKHTQANHPALQGERGSQQQQQTQLKETELASNPVYGSAAAEEEEET